MQMYIYMYAHPIQPNICISSCMRSFIHAFIHSLFHVLNNSPFALILKHLARPSYSESSVSLLPTHPKHKLPPPFPTFPTCSLNRDGWQFPPQQTETGDAQEGYQPHQLMPGINIRWVFQISAPPPHPKRSIGYSKAGQRIKRQVDTASVLLGQYPFALFIFT